MPGHLEFLFIYFFGEGIRGTFKKTDRYLGRGTTWSNYQPSVSWLSKWTCHSGPGWKEKQDRYFFFFNFYCKERYGKMASEWGSWVSRVNGSCHTQRSGVIIEDGYVAKICFKNFVLEWAWTLAIKGEQVPPVGFPVYGLEGCWVSQVVWMEDSLPWGQFSRQLHCSAFAIR